MPEIILQTVREFPQRPLEIYTCAAQIRYEYKKSAESKTVRGLLHTDGFIHVDAHSAAVNAGKV